MTFEVEKEWTTEAGLKAVVLCSVNQMLTSTWERKGHRCGYVGVPPSFSTYGKGYSEQLPEIKQEDVDNIEIGNKSPCLILTAVCNSDIPGETVRRSLDILINAHGGLTYAGGNDNYPIERKEGEEVWWFGFDCCHYDDIEEIGGQTLEYCIAECESISSQLVSLEERKYNEHS